MPHVGVCSGCSVRTVLWGTDGYCVANACQAIEEPDEHGRRRPRDEQGRWLRADAARPAA